MRALWHPVYLGHSVSYVCYIYYYEYIVILVIVYRTYSL